MPFTPTRRSFLTGLGAFAALGTLAGCSSQATPVSSASANGLPEQMVWTTYGAGTGTYNDVAAIANTLTQREGVRVRLMTSDTGIGRVAPLINGTAQYSRIGDEYYYAFEGNDEYASETWGPQPLRQVWSPPGNYGVLVREDSGIEKVEDLAGRRYPRLVASTSMNRKLEAILNYGGLTPNDVQLVDISYSEQTEAMKTGQLDAMYQNVVGSNVEELASRYPIRWLDLGGDDPTRYETWETLSPMVQPGKFTDGAGMADGESAVNLQYTLPLTTLSDRPVSEVRSLLEALHRHFDRFKNATPDAHKFAADQIMLTPLVIPFHEGTVQFLQEFGRWTPDLQARNDALLDREEKMVEAWPGFWAQHAQADDVSERWRNWKSEKLPALPPVNDLADNSAASAA
jgi:uncharacterized protein